MFRFNTMTVALVATSGVLAAVLVLSAVRKLGRSEEVVRSYARAGVPEDRLALLAAILVAGAAGLLVGLAWTPIGVAAAAALVVYFATAVAFHVRAGDASHAPTPAALVLLAAAVLVLQLTS